MGRTSKGTTKSPVHRTHPFISFKVDPSRLPVATWVKLGECSAICRQIAGVPLRRKTAEKLHEVYLAKGVQATTAIEGNSLSEEEVRKRIEDRLELPPSKEYLGKEIDNIVTGCNYIFKTLKEIQGNIRISEGFIKNLNGIIFEGIQIDASIRPGKYRNFRVHAGPYLAPDAEHISFLMKKYCDWLNSEFFSPTMEIDSMVYAILKSIVAHIYLVLIHPFADGNGRTARLLELTFLIDKGVPSIAAHLLSNHYNATRTEYYRQLNTISKKDSIIDFISYAVQGFLDGLEAQFQEIKTEILYVSWRDYVHGAFKGTKSTPAIDRRRRLVLDLSDHDREFKKAELKEVSIRIAQAYAGTTDKTLSRDINDLLNRELIRRTKSGYVANKQIMSAFLPLRVEQE